MALDISLENEAVSAWAFYAVLCLFKVLFMGVLTSLVRVAKGVFTNPEDIRAFSDASDPRKNKPVTDDKHVERVRRNHLNDLENIPAHIIVGFIYLLTQPDPVTALWHFRVFAFSRFIHMFCYQVGLQPWRAIAHFAGFLSTASMGMRVLSAVW